MTDIDYDKLSSMVAEKLAQKANKLTLSKSEVEMRWIRSWINRRSAGNERSEISKT